MCSHGRCVAEARNVGVGAPHGALHALLVQAKLPLRLLERRLQPRHLLLRLERPQVRADHLPVGRRHRLGARGLGPQARKGLVAEVRQQHGVPHDVGRRRPLGRVGVHHGGKELAHGGGDGGGERREAPLAHRLVLLPASGELAVRGELVHAHAQREDVALGQVLEVALQHLPAEVPLVALVHQVLGGVGGGDEAEVAELVHPPLGPKHVFRLDIHVREVGRVHVGQPGRELHQDRRQTLLPEGPLLLADLCEGACAQLCLDEEHVVLLPRVVVPHHVDVVNLRRVRVDLPQEPLALLGRAHRRADLLDGVRAQVDLAVALVDPAAAPLSNLLEVEKVVQKRPHRQPRRPRRPMPRHVVRRKAHRVHPQEGVPPRLHLSVAEGPRGGHGKRTGRRGRHPPRTPLRHAARREGAPRVAREGGVADPRS
mmetsp:Transcript_7513/g.14695  ORF Transcript_7513/g.14695 Transcript_7513/m.14695 type:complete len:427 (-) Transcript_7513:1335-2615(-)